MTTEKLIKKVNNIIVSLPEEDRKAANYMLSKSPERFGDTGTTPALLTDLLKDLQDDLKNEAAKASGKLSAKKAAEKIFKQLKNINKLFGTYVSDGKQIIGGSCSCVRLSEPLPLQEYPAGETPLNYVDILNSTSQNKGEALTLPSLAELTAHNKTQKALNKHIKKFSPTYDFGEGLPAVDGEKLAEVLTILGSSTRATASLHSPLLKAIYFINESGDDGLLMPVRKDCKL